jgi:uncharacterized protein YdeI (BOF family)
MKKMIILVIILLMLFFVLAGFSGDLKLGSGTDSPEGIYEGYFNVG